MLAGTTGEAILNLYGPDTSEARVSLFSDHDMAGLNVRDDHEIFAAIGEMNGERVAVVTDE